MIISDTTLPFNDGWHVRSVVDGESFAPVFLPRDAMIQTGRSADAPSGPSQAYFLGGSYLYRKTWRRPPSWIGKRIFLYFEGVYRYCQVFVNGQPAGGNSWGLTGFEIQIDQFLRGDQEVTIELHVQNEELPSARWYIGSGVLKPVWIVARNPISLRPGGVFFQTIAIEPSVRAMVTVEIDNPAGEVVDVSFSLLDDGEHEVASAELRTEGSQVSAPLDVAQPVLWSDDDPHLYTLLVKVGDESHSVLVGLRTLQWNAQSGLLVNGRRTFLRGACIHHDSGILGGVTLPDYELWRVKILKANGYNAIRSSHNPAPEALLHACDVHGLYVVDEYHDYWYSRKSTHDDAPSFADRWEVEIDAMVRKARNHPSVIMYSIGNELMEPKSVYGLETARRLVERVRLSDSTRPVTAAINLMLAAIGWPAKRTGDVNVQPPSGEAWNLDSTSINALFAFIHFIVKNLPRLPRADLVTKDLFHLVDVSGYNYGEVRFPTDVRLHPDRILLGTETLPDDISWNWSQVESLPSLIGDFMWTGWDYLGESGMADWIYDSSTGSFQKPYPQISAGCGAVDLIGVPGHTAYLAQAAWHLLSGPAITVRPPHLVDKKTFRSPWRKTDAEHSWSWKGCAGKRAEIYVVSDDEEVEVLLNGTSLGKKQVGTYPSRLSPSTVAIGVMGVVSAMLVPSWAYALSTLAGTAMFSIYTLRPPGRRYGNLARFNTTYFPGEIVAIGYRQGRQTSQTALRSAQEARLKLVLENETIRANGMDLAFIRVLLCDEHGTVEMLDDDLVTLSVTGPARLEGFGSGARKTYERYDDDVHTTWHGQALAIVRAGTEPGIVTVVANSDSHGAGSVVLEQIRE
ncbi:unnamed protein product [Zymoseptoria tritici ST99CH_3D1]|nr:unnamed protein product [Zymoseptoria tritici ST99CH_3D1]